ncbi:DEUP1-like protein [Mya arenaria]|uniref:DEUP1-like protein n=1 Tax=Mya arenaria TaxID=6604 RepID=A0ABY7EUE7_MYAAR|nr:DEUP1-like protein [Mya arenaria]
MHKVGRSKNSQQQKQPTAGVAINRSSQKQTKTDAKSASDRSSSLQQRQPEQKLPAAEKASTNQSHLIPYKTSLVRPEENTLLNPNGNSAGCRLVSKAYYTHTHKGLFNVSDNPATVGGLHFLEGVVKATGQMHEVHGVRLQYLEEVRLPKGALSVNCEPELQELMKQIDKLVAGKKREWEREREGLASRLNEYRQRSRDWEIDRRSLQKQVENLEAQRKAIADKCEFVQQQAQTYQSQLDRRREILDSTEFSLNSQIAQLEAKLNTTAESLKIQNSKVDKLKGSLEEAMDSHKKAMDDNERLLNDLKKANAQCRKLEDLNAELQGELRARDDFLQMSLSDTRCQTEDETITTLRKTVDEVQDQARLSKRNEDLLGQENRQLQQELGIKRDDCENMERKLHQKKQDVARLEEEVATVKLQLSAAEEKLSSINVHHEAELITIKEQLSKVSNELESSSTNLGDVGARARDLEEQVTDGRGEIKKRDAELKKDNVSLRDELGVMRQEVTALEDRFDHQLQRTIHEAEMSHTEELSREQRHLQDLEEDADRRVSMLQDRLDSTINRYEEQLTLLRRQKARVEDDLDRERRAGSSFRQGDIVIEEGEEGVIYVNDDMSLADTDSGNEMNFGIPASEKFLNEEAARTRQLESIIDCHIQTLKSSSDMAIKKHKR